MAVLKLLLLLVIFSNMELLSAKSKNHLLKVMKNSYTPLTYKSTMYSSLTCPENYIRYENSCYFMSMKPQTYGQAKDYAKEYGLQFANMEQLSRARFIVSSFSKVKKGYLFVFRMTSHKDKQFVRRYFFQKYRKGRFIVIDLKNGKIKTKKNVDSLYFAYEKRACKKGEWLCKDSSRCLKEKYLCNRRKECKDGSDEKVPKCQSCGGDIKLDKTQTLKSPGFDKKYPTKTVCTWKVLAKNAISIQVKFKTWELQKYDYDFLRIVGDHATLTFFGEFELKDRVFTFIGSFLEITFNSDRRNTKKGFEIELQPVTFKSSTLDLSTTQPITIPSEEFTIGYERIWQYKTTSTVISYFLKKFYMDSACRIIFYDGTIGGATTKSLTEITGGSSQQSLGVILKTKDLGVKLICGSAFTIQPKQFLFQATVSKGCSMTFDDIASGEFSSPGYWTGDYPDDTVCEYKFTKMYKDTAFYIERFDVLSGAYVQINKDAKKHSYLESLQKALDELSIEKDSSLTIKFTVGKNSPKAKGFRIHFSKACTLQGATLLYNKEKTVKAGDGKVFDDELRTATEKKVACLKGGILSATLKTYSKRCRASAFSFPTSPSTFGLKYSLNSAVPYSCPKGTTSVGVTRFVCAITGWLREGTCKVVKCPTISRGSGLDYSVYPSGSDGILPWRWLVFRCSPKSYWKLEGATINICGLGGKYLFPMATCVRRGCTVPRLPDRRGYWEAQGKEIKVGESTALKCRGFYRPKKSNTRLSCDTPEKTSIINGPAECDEVDVCATSKPCGIHKCINIKGSYECACNKGYINSKDGRSCIDIDECKAKTNPCGSHKCVNTDGDFYCSCLPGYQLYTKTKEVEDFAKKYYPSSVAKKLLQYKKACLVRRCNTPTVKNAVELTKKANFLTHSFSVFRCNDGHEAGGRYLIFLTCSPAGDSVAWKGLTECKPGKCPEKKVVDNGNLQITERDFKKTAKLVCDDGYKEESPSYTCKEHGGPGYTVAFKWTGSGRCIPKTKCPFLSAPSNGGLKITGSIAVYTCKPGFYLSGDPYRFCSDGKWSGKAPSCPRLICPVLNTAGKNIIALDKSTTYHMRFGSRASGYSMSGDSEMRCEIKDSWLEKTTLKWKTVYLCDDSVHQIGCPAGKVIYPVYAVYGYEYVKPKGCDATRGYPSKLCGNRKLSLDYVNSICKGHRTCWIPVTAAMFHTSGKGICEGKTRYLEVTYLCGTKDQTFGSSQALLSCDSIAEGPIKTMLDPEATTASLTNYRGDDKIGCKKDKMDPLIGCMYIKARAIRTNAEMLKYHLYRLIMENICKSKAKTNIDECIKCLDILKKQQTNDLCSPKLQNCLTKNCWKEDPLKTLYNLYIQGSCSPDTHIFKTADANLLAYLVVAPLKFGSMIMRTISKKDAAGNWINVDIPLDLVQNVVKLKAGTYKLTVKLVAKIQVKSIYIHVGSSGSIGSLSLFARMKGISLDKTNFELKRIRGNLIQLVLKTSVPISAFALEFAVAEVPASEEAHLRMSVAYEKPKGFKSVQCYVCDKEAKEEDCRKGIACITDSSQCFSSWKYDGTKATVTKGCALKSDIEKWTATNKCYSSKKVSDISCTSACESDNCNGYGYCPPWSDNCKTGMNLDIYDLTLSVTSILPKIEPSCSTEIRKFLFSEMAALWEAFSLNSCSGTKSTITHKMTSDRRDISLSLAIRREYSVKDGYECQEKSQSGHKPFLALMKKWSDLRTKAFCDGKVKLNPLVRKVYHYCDAGSVFDEVKGWCRGYGLMSRSVNVLLNKTLATSVTIEKSSGEKYSLTSNGEFSGKSGGLFTVSVKFSHVVMIKNVSLLLIGSGYRLTEFGSHKSLSTVKYMESLNTFANTYSFKFRIEGSSTFSLFLGLSIARGMKFINCYQCTAAKTEGECLSKKLCPSQGYACFTTWKKDGSAIRVDKGCADVETIARWKTSSQCCKEHDEAVQGKKVECTSSCSQDSCNSHSLCPVWKPDKCEEGLNYHTHTISVVSESTVTSEVCHKDMSKVIKNVLGRTATKYKESLCKGTKLEITHGGYIKGTRVLNSLTLRHEYHSYNLPPCFEKKNPSVLKKDLFDVLLTFSPVTLASCSVGRNVHLFVSEKTDVHRCAFGSQFNTSTRICHDPNVLPQWKNVKNSKSVVDKIDITKEDKKKVAISSQGYIEVDSNVKYDVKIKLKKDIKKARVILRLFGAGLNVFLKKENAYTNNTCDRKTLSIKLAATKKELEFSFYIQGFSKTPRKGHLTFGLEEYEDDDDKSTGKSQIGTGGGKDKDEDKEKDKDKDKDEDKDKSRRRKRSATNPTGSLVITRDANLTEKYTPPIKVFTASEVEETKKTAASSVVFSWVGTLPSSKDVESPKPAKGTVCPVTRTFNERSTTPVQHAIRLKGLWPSFVDNSGETLKVSVKDQPTLTKYNELAVAFNWEKGLVFETADSSGNKFECAMKFQWKDVTKPTVSCPDRNYIQSVDGSSSVAAIKIPKVNPSDINGIESIKYSVKPDTLLPIAVPHLVRIYVTDKKKNVATCEYYHTMSTTACKIDGFLFESKKNMVVTKSSDGSYLVKCDAGFSYGATFENQKSLTCSGGKLKDKANLLDYNTIPPCLAIAGYYAVKYEVKVKNKISQACCNSAFTGKSLTQRINSDLSCVTKNFKGVMVNVKTKWTSEISSPKECTFTFDILLKYDESANDAELKACGKQVATLLKKKSFELGSDKSTCKKNVEKVKIDGDATLNGVACPPGHVGKVKSVLVCVPCFKGTFYNAESKKCEPCDFDTYQDEYGQTSCKSCPENTGTQSKNARSKSSCLPKCPAGRYKKTGRSIEPCDTCAIGFYNKKVGATECTKCVTDKTTATSGSTDEKQCQSKCAAGEYSTTGLAPCLKCPKHFIQKEKGKTSCTPCPSGKGTSGEGSSSETDCKAIDQCVDNSCKNGAECVKEPFFQYSCKCKAGYEGEKCEKQIDLCKSNPCLLGTCKPGLDKFTCECIPGVKGTICNEADYCSSKPCKNGATCKSTAGSYSCEGCDATKYTGKDCDEPKDPCAGKPCKNDGKCVQDGTSSAYTCECKAQYEGSTCEKKKDACVPSPCRNGGTCKKEGDGHKCVCTSAWQGATCEVDKDECAGGTNVCKNGGTCMNIDGGYQCYCKKGFEGLDCGTVTDQCKSSPCKNGGNCTSNAGGFKCDCEDGYTGDTCEDEVNKCEPNPCDKVGTLSSERQVNNCLCRCRNGFEGKQCDKVVNYCKPNPCWNGVKCVDGPDVQNIYKRPADVKFHCECPDYRGGDKCEIQLDTCRDHKCLNGASCVKGKTDYTCACTVGFDGAQCENPVDLCKLEKPCANDGACTTLAGSFSCQCKPGWTGRNCTEQTDECLSKPCHNGGACEDLFNDFKCTCTKYFDGKTCSNEVDVCETAPCQNGGSCFKKTGGGGYDCRCAPGFEGTNCEKNINDCPSVNPCLNGGKCKDLVQTYACECPPVYEGKLCNLEKSQEFDYLFEKSSKSLFVKQSVTVNTALSSMSITFSVRPFVTSKPVILRITANEKAVLDFSVDKLTYIYDASKSITFASVKAGQWSHISLSYKERKLSVFVNGKLEGLISVKELPAGKYDVFFGNYDGSSNFLGEISRFYWRSKAVTDAQLETFKGKCAGIKAPAIGTDNLVDWRAIGSGTNNSKDSLCGSTTCPPGLSGTACGVEDDNEPPKVVFCPSHVVTVKDANFAPIKFREPEFEDNSGSFTVKASHKPEQTFQPGIYSIVWVATDKAGNEATCAFKLTFVKYRCEKPEAPNDQTKVDCTSITNANDLSCHVTCKDPTRYAIPVGGQEFYSCSPESGGWQPKTPGETFKILGCVLAAEPISNAVGKMIMTLQAGEDCKAKKTIIINQFISFVKTVKEKSSSSTICTTADCSDIKKKVSVTCDTGRRRKRAAPTASVTYSLPGGGQSANTMCDYQRSNRDPTTGPGGSMTAGPCPTATPTCDNGYILNEGKCVACPAGSYQVNPYDTTCTPCPKSKYSDSSGATECKNCPGTQTTPGVGANSADLCYEVCPAGKYMNPSSGNCESCPTGSIQPSAGQAQCLTCPAGSASDSGGKECKKCTAGQQLDASGRCAPCPKGFYRPDDPNQATCLPCASALTTKGEGSKAATDCSVPICNAGEYRNADNLCKKCPLGTYQPSRGQATCLRCGMGNTTNSTGSTADTACTPGEVNECEVGSAFCHKHATCKDTPKSFECTCNKPNWIGNGVKCTCADGYAGDACEIEKKPEGLTNAQIGGIVGGCCAVVIVIIIIIVVVYLKKRKVTLKRSKTRTKESAGYDVNPISNTYASVPDDKSYGMENDAYDLPYMHGHGEDPRYT